MRGDSARVQELELELRNLRVAFEEYIGSSRELEDGLDRELADMHGKLAQSSAANEMLGSQLENMEPLVRKLETSLEVTKKKLREEARMRRQAELAQVEIEDRYKESESDMMALREDNENLRDECEALHEELAFKCRELEDVKTGEDDKLRQLDELSQIVGSTANRREERSTEASGMNQTTENTLNTKADTNMDDSYAEVLDELETVTEQLIATQQKLWKTEDKLRESDSRVRELNHKLKRKTSSGDTVTSEVENEEKTTSEAEKRLMDELSLLKDELAMANEEVKAAKEQASSYQDRLKALGASNATGVLEQKSKVSDLRTKVRGLEKSSKEAQKQIAEYEELIEKSAEEAQKQIVELEDLLEESREENAGLIEEVSCLRDLLPSQSDADPPEKGRAQYERTSQGELDELREKITQETRSSVLQQANKEREREINLLREKFKKIFKENAVLRQKVEHLEGGLPTQKRDSASVLKEENERLNTLLKTTRENHRSEILETESAWREKLQSAAKELPAQNRDSTMSALKEENDRLHTTLKTTRKQLEKVTAEAAGMHQDTSGDTTNEILESLEREVKNLSEEKYYLEEKVKSLERVLQSSRQEKDRFNQKSKLVQNNLRTSRDEVLKLKKKTGYLAAELENSKSLVAKLDREGDSLRMKYAAVKAELDVSRLILEDSGLEDQTVDREDTIQLKQQIISLSDSLDTIKTDYEGLVAELDESRKNFCDAQEEAMRHSEEQIEHFQTQIEDLETALEDSRLERAELVSELEQAEKKYQEARSEVECTIKQSQNEERRLVMGKFDNLNSKKSFLESKLQDAESKIATMEDNLSSKTLELRNCKTSLMTLQEENSKLSIELENAMNGNTFTEHRGMKALDTLLNEANRTREARDPDPMQNRPDNRGLFIRGDQGAYGYTRDPPTARSITKSNQSVTTETSDNFGVLRSQLTDLTQENEILKKKVLDLTETISSNEVSDSLKSASADETQKLREQINALHICLENAEDKSDEVKTLEKQLEAAESKLQSKEEEVRRIGNDLEQSKQNSDALVAEISALNDNLKETRSNLSSLKDQLAEEKNQKQELQGRLDAHDMQTMEEARRIVTAERRQEFDELKVQLNNLTDEKNALQVQIDDSKIALSVSQYAQERNKEERRECAAKLEAATEEIFNMKAELSKAEYAISESKRKQDQAARELNRVRQRSQTNMESMTESDNLTKQLNELSDENSGLQQVVAELEEALQNSQDEFEKKCEEVRSLENSLVSTQEETRMLTEEISHLSSAFEDAKSEYDAVVDELEAVNELFDEARQEAERTGREAAGEEIRSELLAVQEHERILMKEQVQKILDENATLQEKLNVARRATGQTNDSETDSGEMELARQEVEILKEALRSSSEQVKALKEKELNLSLSLKETKGDLKQAQDLLEVKMHKLTQQQSAENSYDDVLSSAGHSSAESSTEYRSLRDHFRRLIETCENRDATSGSSEPNVGYKAEGLRLKVELMDMSMSLERLMKENLSIEEELARLKSASREMCAEAERQGRLDAIKEVRAELKAERQVEMQEFKERFNELALDNATLEQKVQDTTIALEVAKKSQEQKIEELNMLEDDLAKSKKETRNLKEEIFNLTIEVESNKRGGYVQNFSTTKDDSKVKALNRKLSALNMENTALQAKLRSAGATNDRNAGEQNRAEVDAVLESLKESSATIKKLEEKIDSLDSEMHVLRSENNRLSEERSNLKNQVKQAEATIAAKKSTQGYDSKSRAEAEFLRSQLEKFVEEKAVLQKEVDDARISLSLAKLSPATVQKLRHLGGAGHSALEMPSTRQAADLATISFELQKAKIEHDAAIELLEQMNDTLSSIEGDFLSSNGRRTGRNKSETVRESSNDKKKSPHSLLDKADEVAQRMTSFASMVLQSNREHAAVLAELDATKVKIGEAGQTHDQLDREFRRTLTQEKESEMKALREQIKLFFSQNAELEEKMKEAENELSLAQETMGKQKIELEMCEMKYEESRKEASQSKREVSMLQSTLEGAQHDHRALREQLEGLNTRVGQLCREAEERGKAAAAEELRVGIRSLKEQERQEFLNQFNLFYKENLALQQKLDETESALAASREAQNKYDNESRLLDLDAKASYEKAAARVEQLETINKRLRQEIDSLKQDLENAKNSGDEVERELESMRQRLHKDDEKSRALPDALTKSDEHRSVSSERTAELRLLQDQFKKLSAKSMALGYKVEEAENAVATVRDQQDKTLAATESRTRMAEKLKSKIDKVADDSKKKDEEMEELSIMMENRVALTEENVKSLEQEISIAKGALQVSNAGLVVIKRERSRDSQLPPPSPVGSKDLGMHEGEYGGTRIRASQSMGERPRYESRDDETPSQSPSVKRTRSYSPVPKTEPGTLEAIEGGKQKAALKRFDLKNAQRKIFGNDAKATSRTSPFAKRMAKHAKRLELNREKQQLAAETVVSDASTKDNNE